MSGEETGFEGRKTIKNPEKHLKSNVFADFMLIKSDYHEFSKVITEYNVGIFIKVAQMEIKLI